MGLNMDKNDVEVIGKETRFDGFFRLDHYRLKHRLFKGGWSGAMSREVFERGHAVAALLYDPDLDRLVMVEQFRPGAYAALASPWFDENTHSPWLVEFIAGIIGEGENPEDVARRESREEANCEIKEIIPVYHYFSSPGGSSESVFFFCGRVNAGTAGGIHGLPHENEDIRVFTVSVKQALQWLETGEINNALTLIGLQWLYMNHERVRALWRNT
ncbi:MAG TPA: NUDIX domain-containing protein [Rhodospirillales bacterium]|nr:NUDIX domain-containing protein [Rhodospirillales bacterium]